MVIYTWYHWLYIYILGIGITNPLVWLVLPWAPEAKLAILRAHPAEVAGSSWGLVRCKEEVPDQRDKFEQFWKWCMCFWSFYTSWWFVAIDFDSCGLCRSKTGKVLSHRLHQAIVYLSTGVKAPMFQDAREPKKKNTMFHWVPLLTFALSHCLWCAWLCYICTWPFPTCCDWCHDKSHWQLCIGSASKVDHRLKTCAELLLMINVYCLHIYGPYQCSSGPHFCTHLLTHPSWLGSSPCGSFQTRGMFGQYQKKKNLRLLNFPFHVT
jgi:hypothetical protein